MRFPYCPAADNPALRLAEKIRGEGYDTVILLPLQQERLDSIRSEVIQQLRHISGETLLFCYHLEQLTIEVDDPPLKKSWTLVREEIGNSQTIVIDDCTGSVGLWWIHRRIGELPRDVLDNSIRETPRYEIAVAVPEVAEEITGNRLCVFFPTEDVLPTALLAHATLATDDSRKRILPHAANRHVLKRLAQLMAEVAETVAEQQPDRGLTLLAGVERCDNELVQLGFRDALVIAARSRRLLPRFDGLRSKTDDVRVCRHRIWHEIATPNAFPELLVVREPRCTGFVELLGPKAYTGAELVARLQTMLSTMQPAEAGKVIGKLLSGRQLPTDPLGNFLRDMDGRTIDADHTVFFQPEGTTSSFPAWATTIHFLDSKFAEAARSASGSSTIRDLRSKLAECGYGIEDFQFEALARRLEDVAFADNSLLTAAVAERCRGVLSTLFRLSRGQSDSATLRASVSVLTEHGARRPARSLYFSDVYAAGRLVDPLYRSLGEDEFVADPSSLGLGSEPVDKVVEFLKRLGVADSPRMKVPTDLKSVGLGSFIDSILDTLNYPNRDLDLEVTSVEDVKSKFGHLRVFGLSLPDRFSELLQLADVEPLIAFLSAEGAALWAEPNAAGAVLQALTGNQRAHRDYPAVGIPNPTLHLLRSAAWVPCEDGLRRRTDHIILTRTGSTAFAGTFFRHAISGTSEVLRGRGGRSTVDSVLLRLGAINSLDSLSTRTLYDLLLELPARDTRGTNAASIYRTVLEVGGIETDSPRRSEFVEKGQMWGSKENVEGYFPVKSLRYWPRGALPRPLRQIIPLVAIDPRKNTKEIQRIFGVATLRPDDFTVTLDRHATIFTDWTVAANAHLVAARSFLYALRLSQRADDDGRQRRVLSRSQLFTCRRISAAVSFDTEKDVPVVVEDDLEGLTIGSHMYLVCGENEIPLNDSLFWRAVTDLLADLLEAGTHAAEFALLLMCDTPRQRLKLLNHITEGQGDELLQRALKALEVLPEEETVNPLPLPRSSSESEGSANRLVPAVGSTGKDESSSGTVPLPIRENPTFIPTDAPTRRSAQRRPLVVVRPSKSHNDTVRVPLFDENETLEIVEQFERCEDRYPIRLNHVHGYQGPRCDIVSVATAASLDAAIATGSLDLREVVRFIEVKGRNQRTGAVQLTENELSGAQEYGDRYFVYRVFCDPLDDTHRQLAILQNPAHSQTMTVTRTATLSLDDGSGAEWFKLMYKSANDNSIPG
jgi:hypothetical protein